MSAIGHDDHYFQHADRLLEMRRPAVELTGEERAQARDAVYGLMLAASPGKTGRRAAEVQRQHCWRLLPPRAMAKASARGPAHYFKGLPIVVRFGIKSASLT